MQRNPDAWAVDRFWAKHKGGLQIWMGSGFLGCHVEKPEYMEFPLWDRIRVHRALKHLIKS
ncbi:MAG: hypothetical protein HQM12_02935 [SAR324 cluster bacterium]|nr:hypothetical protein [SAR324 cluster bacterium]MBF0349722.1 hypothetical protein [SAR324 cluster bacterium]